MALTELREPALVLLAPPAAARATCCADWSSTWRQTPGAPGSGWVEASILAAPMTVDPDAVLSAVIHDDCNRAEDRTTGERPPFKAATGGFNAVRVLRESRDRSRLCRARAVSWGASPENPVGRRPATCAACVGLGSVESEPSLETGCIRHQPRECGNRHVFPHTKVQPQSVVTRLHQEHPCVRHSVDMHEFTACIPHTSGRIST